MGNYRSQPDFTRQSSAKKSGNGVSGGMKLIMIILALVIVALIAGIIIVSSKNSGKTQEENPVIILTAVPTGANVTEPPVTEVPTNVPEAPVIDSVVIEAGSELPGAQAFLKEGREDLTTYYLSSVSSIDTTVCGIYPLEIQCGDSTYDVEIIVRDTVPPSGVTKNVTVPKGTEVKPEDFIASVDDITNVEIAFAAPVDTSVGGTREVSILLRDGGGNETVLSALLTVDVDEVPPVIEAIAYREIFAGDTISYREGLSVSDDRGGEVSVSIDSSGVNLKVPGTYQVIYTATDESGNTSTFTATIVVRDPSELETPEGKYSEAAMHKKFRELLPKVIDSSMNDIEKLYAIWTYVSEHISYVSHSDKDSYVREAIRGLDEGTGDCFTYYAAMKAFMEEAGFETISVQRINGSTQHFWSLVKVNGEWYHIDACPRAEVRLRYWYCFLRTDEELLGFGSWEGQEVFDKVNYYYQFDTTLYPKSATTNIAEAHVNWDTGEIELQIF